ncbi:MAG: hypothetical protein RSB37_04720 [Acetivibrio sp.]
MQLISNVLVIIILALLGGIPTFYLALSMPAVIVYKFYRKIRFGTSLMD